MKVNWLDEPEEHDYPAAEDYLTLLCSPDHAAELARELRTARAWHAKAKDIARASDLPLLSADDPHVAHDLDKIKAGTPLSPILLIRGSLAHQQPLVIADGYHRVCAVFHVEPNTMIPARIVDR